MMRLPWHLTASMPRPLNVRSIQQIEVGWSNQPPQATRLRCRIVTGR